MNVSVTFLILCYVLLFFLSSSHLLTESEHEENHGDLFCTDLCWQDSTQQHGTLFGFHLHKSLILSWDVHFLLLLLFCFDFLGLCQIPKPALPKTWPWTLFQIPLLPASRDTSVKNTGLLFLLLALSFLLPAHKNGMWRAQQQKKKENRKWKRDTYSGCTKWSEKNSSWKLVQCCTPAWSFPAVLYSTPSRYGAACTAMCCHGSFHKTMCHANTWAQWLSPSQIQTHTHMRARKTQSTSLDLTHGTNLAA